ncbi:hypothetical protein B0H17DRAFT_1216065 [Mycena rosella]|uniref:Uncharacterized protein n=1 Tax=Mycena rosella TaxID=1033263 RepID=A0AAD7CCQ6_MYCRO|nr:hypothetical protein B0H17DRAFT_1216065 [Mycena rosella]
MQLRGAKLSTLMQKTAYAGIKEKKAEVTRKASDNNVRQVTLAIQHTFKRRPNPAQIWKRIRHKDFTRQVKNFLWKSLHSAHRIGSYWKHIPECEDRATCQCRRTEFGAATFTDEKGRNLPGVSRLYRILISESIFMIWKVRNECVITKGGDSSPVNMVHNKWLHAINQRLLFDRVLTNHAKYGKQNSIKTSVVLHTWSSTLLNEEDLPEDWTKEPRVLVGTEPKSSRSPPQPSGRRGQGR